MDGADGHTLHISCLCTINRSIGTGFASTSPVHVEGVMPDVEFKNVCHHLLDALDPRVAELEQFIAIHADQVVMLPKTVGGLVLGLLVSELVFGNQLAFTQELECVVDGRPAHFGIPLEQDDVQFVGVEMAILRIDRLQYGKPLGRLPLISGFEVV
jgi:hypothetical protein